MNTRPYSAFSEEDDDSGVAGFMCYTDFAYELGCAAGGNQVYPSIDDLKSNRKCVEGCGIIEVRVIGHRVIQEPNDDLE